MTTLNAVFALVAAFMLLRHVPRAVRLLRTDGSRADAVVSILNVVLAAVILVLAVKGLSGALIAR